MDIRERQVLSFYEAYDVWEGEDEDFPYLDFFGDVGSLLYALKGYGEMIMEEEEEDATEQSKIRVRDFTHNGIV